MNRGLALERWLPSVTGRDGVTYKAVREEGNVGVQFYGQLRSQS